MKSTGKKKGRQRGYAALRAAFVFFRSSRHGQSAETGNDIMDEQDDTEHIGASQAPPNRKLD